MRIQNAGRRGVNHEQMAAAVRAGHALAVLANLEASSGLALDSRINGGRFSGILLRDVVELHDDDGKVIGTAFGGLNKPAFDSQPELITVGNSGIPAYLANLMDPAVIDVIVAPMKAAMIAGETKKGDWTTATTTFKVVESDGEVSAYGDFSNAGNADTNINYPQRQSFHYQTFTQWGEKELAWNGLAGVDLASQKNVASVLVLNKFQNKSYFFGIAGLQNYGLLNDPALLPPIVPTTTWDAATADQCYQNVLDLYKQLVRQGNGVVEDDMSMTLALSNNNATNLKKTNQYGLNVYALIRENFPNLSIKTAPEYSTASGELVQLILNEYEGKETVTAAFTEKLRAHAVIPASSSFSQKKSQGTWGTIIFRPVFIAQMLG